jgi:hypothetical protein
MTVLYVCAARFALRAWFGASIYARNGSAPMTRALTLSIPLVWRVRLVRANTVTVVMLLFLLHLLLIRCAAAMVTARASYSSGTAVRSWRRISVMLHAVVWAQRRRYKTTIIALKKVFYTLIVCNSSLQLERYLLFS